jgi:VanZ family protein
MIRTQKRMILCCLLLIIMLAVIWGNSLNTGAESGAMSGRVLAWINALLRLEGSDAETLHLAIRKMAHFTEFACLGTLLAWLFGMMGEKKGHLVCMPLFCGLLAACVDETIQLFVPDRGPSLIDVWIDTAGTAAGITLLLIGYNYIGKKQKHS